MRAVWSGKALPAMDLLSTTKPYGSGLEDFAYITNGRRFWFLHLFIV
jgi:hypothetical protein